MAFETYYAGELESLVGLKSKTKTVGIENKLVAYGSTPHIQILNSNPRRVAAIVFNNGTVGVCLYLTQVGAGYIVLNQNGVFQMDKNFPYTGVVWLTVPSEQPATVSVMEMTLFE